MLRLPAFYAGNNEVNGDRESDDVEDVDVE